MMKCDHSYDKKFVHISSLPGEIYMCECGALIDTGAERNAGVDAKMSPMTPNELEEAISSAMGRIITQVFDNLKKATSKSTATVAEIIKGEQGRWIW